MTVRAENPNGLAQALLETADGMHRIGVLDTAAHAKITMRHLGRHLAHHPANADPAITPLSGPEIRALRERANLSQAVFARTLNLTVGYVSQMERGVKRPTGAVVVLLDVIRRKGIAGIL